MLNLLKDLENDITEKWLDIMPVKINENMNKPLFVMEEDYSLKLNFTDEVSRVEKFDIDYFLFRYCITVTVNFFNYPKIAD